MKTQASNRQRKLLRFFEIPFGPNISAGAAGWHIGWLMADEPSRERWERYLYLTGDFDSTSDQLMPFAPAQLEAVRIPAGWNSEQARSDVAAKIMTEQTPFDFPQPEVHFAGQVFIFTGKFEFGSRKQCQDAVIACGGKAPDSKSVSHDVDYLVIGTQGSPRWKRGSFGNKIENGILARRDFGSPAIISEDHWKSFL
ncbi:MAG: BRCT domain-containing protein [Verrucomicrobia bacterium]|nr:BRCT domain-containing protein [Verrucomicrobiota bacterium]